MYLVTENKKYLDRFLFYFYFYFTPSTQIFLKISRKTFYKKNWPNFKNEVFSCKYTQKDKFTNIYISGDKKITSLQ